MCSHHLCVGDLDSSIWLLCSTNDWMGHSDSLVEMAHNMPSWGVYRAPPYSATLAVNLIISSLLVEQHASEFNSYIFASNSRKSAPPFSALLSSNSIIVCSYNLVLWILTMIDEPAAWKVPPLSAALFPQKFNFPLCTQLHCGRYIHLHSL